MQVGFRKRNRRWGDTLLNGSREPLPPIGPPAGAKGESHWKYPERQPWQPGREGARGIHTPTWLSCLRLSLWCLPLAKQDRKPEDRELIVATLVGQSPRVQKPREERLEEHLEEQRGDTQNTHNNPI